MRSDVSNSSDFEPLRKNDTTRLLLIVVSSIAVATAGFVSQAEVDIEPVVVAENVADAPSAPFSEPAPASPGNDLNP
jgi:hypothetical protein